MKMAPGCRTPLPWSHWTFTTAPSVTESHRSPGSHKGPHKSWSGACIQACPTADPGHHHCAAGKALGSVREMWHLPVCSSCLSMSQFSHRKKPGQRQKWVLAQLIWSASGQRQCQRACSLGCLCAGSPGVGAEGSLSGWGTSQGFSHGPTLTTSQV